MPKARRKDPAVLSAAARAARLAELRALHPQASNAGLQAMLAKEEEAAAQQAAADRAARRRARPAPPPSAAPSPEERVAQALEEAPEAGGAPPPPPPPKTPPRRRRPGGGRVPPEAIERAAAEPLNDTGNGQRLLHHFGEDLMHVRDVGWHWWAETHWEREGGDEAAVRFAQATAERINLEIAIVGEASEDEQAVIEAAVPAMEKRPAERDEVDRDLMAARAAALDAIGKRRTARRKFAISSGNAPKVNAMLSQALPHRTVAPEDLDADPLAFNCRNGTLHFVHEVDPECPDEKVVRLIWRVEFRPHDRKDLISKVAPVDYDPDAEAPAFVEAMNYFQPHDPTRTFLQDYYGYSITGLGGDQSLIFNYGGGSNGKSTVTEALWRVIGTYAESLNAESVTGYANRRGDQATPDFARLPGARAVRVTELPRGEPLRESIVKLLTGGEPMLVRHLNKGFFKFRPVFKTVMSGNDKPDIHGVDYGIWRRIRLVPWNVTVPEGEQRDFEDVQRDFEPERSGILNWLIAGALRVLNNGGRVQVPPEVRLATQELREDMDPVGRFLDACVVRSEGSFVTARDLFEYYQDWCYANSVRAFSEKRFAQIMTHKPFTKKEGRVRIYEDMDVLNPPPPRPMGKGGQRQKDDAGDREDPRIAAPPDPPDKAKSP